MEGTYNHWLVVTSVVVAILAAYTALDMVNRVNRSRRSTAILWLMAGGAAMGVGIWSMHFIGMLAFRLPIAIGFDPLITLVSMAASMASSTFALWLVSQATLPTWRVIPGAVLMGAGIATMHYLGMEAMQMQPGIQYQPLWFVGSIIVAIVASWTALRVFYLLRNQQKWTVRLAASALLGLAIVGMHYTGMAAAQFPPDAVCGAADGQNAVNPNVLAVIVTLLTVTALGVVLLLSLMDRKMESRMLRMRNAMLSLSLEEANAELSMAALRDPLTRLPNRHMLMSALATAMQDDGKHVLYVVDINEFQRINEAYGHTVGDQLLITVAERLGEFMRAGDTLARIGSDEFALLTRHQTDDDPEGLSARILDSLNTGIELEGRPVSLTANLGFATAPDSARTAGALLSQADAAMRQARINGRNRWQRFSTWMSENNQEQLQLLGDLRHALEQDQLTLLYQPKLRTRDNCIIGAEALIGWEHPERGTIPGDRISQLAERGGLTERLGKWVIAQACAQLGLWHRAGQQNWHVSVNLSPLQFQDAALEEHIKACLDRHDLPARSLVLEISEGLLLRDSHAGMAIINSLGSLGVGISIDDFGTGNASLLHLKQLPATELKIGQHFVHEMTQGSADSVIVAALIGLVHGLEMDVVGEGVNTREQRLQLERMGCDFLQGSLIGPPVPPARFIQLHASRPITVCDDTLDHADIDVPDPSPTKLG